MTDAPSKDETRRRRIRRRIVDWEETLQRFERRIRQLPPDVLERCLLGQVDDEEDEGDARGGEGLPVYITSYDVWNTITDIDDAETLLEDPAQRSNALLLLKIARERFIPIAGVATERRVGGVLVAAPPEPHRRVYVGRYNTFSTPPLPSHPTLSIISRDKAYVINDEGALL